MAYATQTDLEKRVDEDTLIALTDDAGAGVVDATNLGAAITAADNQIDSYIGTRHALPLGTVPSILTDVSCDLAIYNLHSRRGHVGVPEIVQKRRDEAVAWLKDVSKGVASLGVSDPDGSPPDTNAVEVSSDNPARIFDRSKLEGF